MKNFIKQVITVLLFIFLFSNSALPILAQEGCVIPPVPPYESNKACVYTSYSGTYDILDSCYQKYLSLKNDYAQRCKSYWDSKNTAPNPIAPTSVPQVIEVIKEVVVTPTSASTPKRTYYTNTPTEEPKPTLKPNSIIPSEENYYDDEPKIMPQQQGNFFSTIYNGIANFFKQFFK